jgi:hypothetical protein
MTTTILTKIEAQQAALTVRMTAAVSKALGTPIEFSGWHRDYATGADIPTFVVPERLLARALELGLTCETVREADYQRWLQVVA